jgi:hypothetical protein
MLLVPIESLLPLRVNTAVADEPDAVSVAVPSEAVPTVKVTMPVGAVVPLAGLTVAVNCVVAVDAMLTGLAARVVVVATAGVVTVTVVDAVELEKFPVGA